MHNPTNTSGFKCSRDIDIVMCIDGTASMLPIIDEIKKNTRTFYPRFVDEMQDAGEDFNVFRVKVIVFRDYGYDEKPMEESEFFILPDQVEEFDAFVQGIEAVGGGDVAENALEAIALAIKSDWTTGGKHRRHSIVVFTDAEALPLGKRADSPGYPAGMPADINELKAWIEGKDDSLKSNFLPISGRLLVFAPKTYPWTDLNSLNRYWAAYSEPGTGLSGLDFSQIVYLLVGTM